MKDQAGIERVQDNWYDCLADLPQGATLEPLGPDYAAIHVADDAILLVTFERARQIRDTRPRPVPLAETLAEAAGWSRLTLVAANETWFRDPAVYAYFDRLVDEGFFDEYDRVIFYGAGMCGYAAAAFSVTAPGSTVIALAPQATLDPERAGWDGRYRTARRLDFTSRYGYGPAMAEAADHVYVIHDPSETLDAMHSALFDGTNVTRLRAPLTGPAIEAQLMEMGVLPELIDAAGEGQLTPMVFYRLFRARRCHMPYLRALSARLEADGQTWRAALVCRHTVREKNAPRFRRRLTRLEEALSQEGRALPREPLA
ncbi:hypothetical protein EV663_101479 [Rhodovulum bhavnagarense]|uniref:Phosphoadenosine phosphosulfate reductase n=1 Tax=Rhodovulum bhavnagarense TaxID=992286 RepID=A0A4R2RTI5_9RHOB|nr:phosphoadenosine phosphosulfate reductase [Rhodovulum bhavnagarense]TCP63211.1 hypothetical protein EV663_101479 [Rhodovulum bhavnagarense]